MSFDPGSILVSLVVSGVGLVLLAYGRKQQRFPHILAGLIFMVYPYFVDGVVAMLTIAVVLGAALWLAVRTGW